LYAVRRASHDWLPSSSAAWIACPRRTRSVIGRSGRPLPRSGRRLAQVALVVQQLAEIQVEP